MSPEFVAGLGLGAALTALFFLPWTLRLQREQDELTARYLQLLAAAQSLFGWPAYRCDEERPPRILRGERWEDDR